MKKLLLIFILFLSQTVNSQEIKLLCKVNGKRTVINKSYSEDFKISENVLFKIKSNSKSELMITFEGLSNVFVKTYVISWVQDRVIDVINNSDTNSWDITNKFKTEKDGEGNLSVMIDRNSGIVTVREFFQFNSNSISESNISGQCEKSETTKRKF